MRFVLCVSAVIALAGCASAGVQISEQAATQFKEGVTTETEIVKALGHPTSTSISEGKRVISYTGVQYQVRGATFVPIVGLFAGGADYKMSVAKFDIGANGVLEKITYTTSDGSTRNGMAPAPMPAADPRAVK